MVDALWDRYWIAPGETISEPCAGEGNIVRRLEELGGLANGVDGNDIDAKYNWGTMWDATDPKAPMWTNRPRYDWVVTNPPFSAAIPIIDNALKNVRVGVAVILRLSFLEPTRDRDDWWKKNGEKLVDLIVFGSPRPRYVGKGTDFVTTAWFVFLRGKSVPGVKLSFATGWR
jgi:hypothetical protein